MSDDNTDGTDTGCDGVRPVGCTVPESFRAGQALQGAAEAVLAAIGLQYHSAGTFQLRLAKRLAQEHELAGESAHSLPRHQPSWQARVLPPIPSSAQCPLCTSRAAGHAYRYDAYRYAGHAYRYFRYSCSYASSRIHGARRRRGCKAHEAQGAVRRRRNRPGGLRPEESRVAKSDVSENPPRNWSTKRVIWPGQRVLEHWGADFWHGGGRRLSRQPRFHGYDLPPGMPGSLMVCTIKGYHDGIGTVSY